MGTKIKRAVVSVSRTVCSTERPEATGTSVQSAVLKKRTDVVKGELYGIVGMGNPIPG
jgi:hypothetical protein